MFNKETITTVFASFISNPVVVDTINTVKEVSNTSLYVTGAAVRTVHVTSVGTRMAAEKVYNTMPSSTKAAEEMWGSISDTVTDVFSSKEEKAAS